MNAHRDSAVQILDHYITRIMTKAGMKVDSDTHMEVAQCVDDIIAAACEAILEQLESMKHER